MTVLSETRTRVNRSSQAKSPPVITDPSLSPNDFARAESISLGLLYKLWKAGDGPAYFYIGRSHGEPGGKPRRLSNRRTPRDSWPPQKRRAPQPNRLSNLARLVVLASMTTAKLHPIRKFFVTAADRSCASCPMENSGESTGPISDFRSPSTSCAPRKPPGSGRSRKCFATSAKTVRSAL